MSGGHPQRVIPRPSERRLVVGLPEADIEIIADSNGRPSREPQRETSTPWFVLIGVLAIIGSTAGFAFFGLVRGQDTAAGLAVIPLVGVAGYGVTRRWISTTQGDWLANLMFAGLGVRLFAALPRLLGGADAPLYQVHGVRIASALRTLDFGVETGRAVPGTGTIRYLTGIVNVFTASNYVATFIVFTVLALVGQYAFLLGVRGALSSRQFRILAVLMMFSPSLVFWPSSIGKESPILFGAGLVVFGASRLYDKAWSGIPPVLFGIFAIGMVRPHVAIVFLASVLIGLFARQAHSKGRVASHLVVLVVVIVGLMWAANASAALFGLESLDGFNDVSAALDFAQERTSQDTSQFVVARVQSPADYPLAIVTVLFRPFPWEASGAAALLSALESVALLALVLRAVPSGIAHLDGVLQRGQLLFAVTFTSIFIFLFSAIGNFGILVRQRAQVIPFVFLLVAFGLAADRRRQAGTKS